MNLVLASASPRRAALLRSAGLTFVQMQPDASEAWEGIEILDVPGELAWRKARSVSTGLWNQDESALILGADTIVVFGRRVLEKPKDRSDAKWMLDTLSGETHKVLTGYCILSSQGNHVRRTVVTEVTFKSLTAMELDFYLSTREWSDKAGAYGIQGAAAFMVESIRGSYTNVVGLPLAEVLSDLEVLGIRPSPQ